MLMGSVCGWVQGKAAIDVVCNPLGKSGGSAIQQVMIICFGSLAASTPYLGAILLAVVFVWIGAAGSLNKQACPAHSSLHFFTISPQQHISVVAHVCRLDICIGVCPG